MLHGGTGPPAGGKLERHRPGWEMARYLTDKANYRAHGQGKSSARLIRVGLPFRGKASRLIRWPTWSRLLGSMHGATGGSWLDLVQNGATTKVEPSGRPQRGKDWGTGRGGEEEWGCAYWLLMVLCLGAGGFAPLIPNDKKETANLYNTDVRTSTRSAEEGGLYHAMTSKVEKQNCIVLATWIELVCVAFI